MNLLKLKKILHDIAKSNLTDYSKMNKLSYHHVMKLKALQ